MTPLRRRLFVLGIASIVPLAVMAGLGLQALRRGQREEIQRIGLELSRSVANAVDAELRTVIAVLETLATSPALDRGDLVDFRDRSARLLPLRPEWRGIVLSDTDGTPLVDTRAGDGRTLLPLYETESFRRVVETGLPVVGNLVRGPQADWFFPVRVPVLRGGIPRFVITAVVAPEAIRKVLLRQQVSADWVISIVDSGNLRVARSRAHEEKLGGRLSDTVQQIVDGGGAEGFGIAYALEGERIYTPFTRLVNGWVAVLGLPTARADAAVSRAVFVYGGGIVLSIVLGLLGAVWVGRTITRPIAGLRKAAEALGRRAPLAVPSTGIQEIREVGAAMARAAAELARSEAEREASLRRERLARQAAEAADRAKDEFLAVLSHELRTPLNAVYGWARMLQSGQLRDEAAAIRAKDAIVRNADIQMQMIDDLLDLSRITRAKLRLDVRPIELAPVLYAALDAVRPAAAAKRICLSTAFDAEVPVVNGDPGRLQQVFWNVLMNAVKFTPPQGEIDVRLDHRDSEVHVIVRDTGEGIEPEVLPHVFERFRQGDSSTTRPHGGLGLGLALVKHLTELHGGRVHAASPGRGSGATFTIALPTDLGAGPEVPYDAVSRTSKGDGSAAEVRLDGVRALVVDDDEEGLALAEAILSRAGADVSRCTSAAAAMDLLSRLRPDVLIADIEMPEEDGYSLIRRVRARAAGEGGATPAVALTAYGRAQDRARALAAGYNMHVPKPVDPAELTSIVADIVEHPEGLRGS